MAENDRHTDGTPLRAHALRLRSGEDLREALESWARELGEVEGEGRALFVLTCVGSLRTARLRMAGEDEPIEREGPYEIVALSGTCAPGAHLHVLLGDAQGAVWAGHVAVGCTVATTVEVVVGEGVGLRFSRQLDPQTGYPELRVRRGGRET